MKLVLSLKEIGKEDRRLVGGKAYSLAVMKQQGLAVPDALCVTVEAYDEYVTSTGLRERIMMELSRKSFGEMRWEEMWDASLRIRNMFLKTPIANELVNAIKSHVEPVFNEKAVVVRSSALGEDSSRTSFAGLHESYVNVRGIASILDHVRLVWASLWSDRALLYRQELGLDVEKSKIGVVIQKIVVGEKSGIVFGKSPDNRPLMIVEAVYGMNQGLVDGTLTPDRWLLERNSGRVVSYTPAEKDKIVVPSNKGIQLVYLQNQKGAPRSPKKNYPNCSMWHSRAKKYSEHHKISNGPSLENKCTFSNRDQSQRSRAENLKTIEYSIWDYARASRILGLFAKE